MLKRNRWFVTLSRVYGLIGGLIGLVWLAWPGSLPGNVPRLHGHLMLLGFVTFMIYGLGEHLLPRFTGNPIRLGGWSWAQQAIAHAGVVGYGLGAVLGIEPLALLGAALAWLALALFAARLLPILWPTLPPGG